MAIDISGSDLIIGLIVYYHIQGVINPSSWLYIGIIIWRFIVMCFATTISGHAVKIKELELHYKKKV